MHTTALTPFSATIAWRTSVPASSRIAYGLDAPVIWTPASGASTEHQATLTGLGFDDSYQLAVTAVNDGGAARVAEFVLTTPSLSGPVQMTTSNGAILLTASRRSRSSSGRSARTRPRATWRSASTSSWATAAAPAPSSRNGSPAGRSCSRMRSPMQPDAQGRWVPIFPTNGTRTFRRFHDGRRAPTRPADARVRAPLPDADKPLLQPGERTAAGQGHVSRARCERGRARVRSLSTPELVPLRQFRRRLRLAARSRRARPRPADVPVDRGPSHGLLRRSAGPHAGDAPRRDMALDCGGQSMRSATSRTTGASRRRRDCSHEPCDLSLTPALVEPAIAASVAWRAP